jgi:hypothetical protein
MVMGTLGYPTGPPFIPGPIAGGTVPHAVMGERWSLVGVPLPLASCQ